ncbi:MAG: EAL domain-containing protein, partial [Rhodoferax sp.]|nr:EAL domain-containing protein [Rhodoferax sp.]
RLREQVEKYEISQQHLTHLSQHDSLTGLPNRSFERERTEQAISHARRTHSRVAFLFVDLDNFKAINDSLGHAAGDHFLKQVANRLRMSVRESDIVSRHGGDEFVIALTEVGDAQDISAAATKILDCLTQPIALKETEVVTSCSIGISMFPDDGSDYESLLRCSDIAMYQAKESGRNAYRFFDESMNTNIAQNLLLVSGLRTALEHREFVLHYQPVVDLATGRLIACEALIRWEHPVSGLIPPLEFIAAAEKSGLIVDIGDWVLGEACRQLTQWHAEGHGELTVAVNLSPVQFRRGNIESVVENALLQSGLRPEFLELEITESTLIQDSATFLESLQRLSAMGIKISIDDFGTGYSNLSYLQRFAVHKLKIDRSFVMRMQNGPEDRAIVQAIIQMAKSLKLTTTAEGIEDEAVRHLLMEAGCDQGQGYHFSRPLPSGEFFSLYAQLHPGWPPEVHRDQSPLAL